MKDKLIDASIILIGLVAGVVIGVFMWAQIYSAKTNDMPLAIITGLAIAGGVICFIGPVLTSVVLVFNRIDDREHEAEIWRQETSKMTSDEVQQYKSLLKQCGIKPKGDGKDE